MPTTQMDGLVRTFTEDELLERRSEVVKKLEHRFGSLERTLEREQDWNYDLTWLIVGRLGCWGLVVGGIVRVAWVEVRTNVGV